MRGLPSGTVTFLFTDIEGSTRLLQELGDEYAELLAGQREILRQVLAKWDGREVDTQGDAFFYSFARATSAVNAAVQAQREIRQQAWPQGAEVRVRMGLHTGEPLSASEGYVGIDVHRAARIAHAGHGGQILLSETTSPLVVHQLPPGTSVMDLGRHRLEDMPRPERLSQVVIAGLPGDFPPLRSLESLPPEPAEPAGPLQPPEFLTSESPSRPVFVGRERQLEWLETHFENALGGEGSLGFVVGGPGRGKTALLEAFSRSISNRHPGAMIAWGECTAYAGHGDPYLPFRQVFKALTGDLQPLWLKARIERRNALRMWETLPATLQTVVRTGPGLVGGMVSGTELLARGRQVVQSSTPWLERLGTLADRPSGNGDAPDQARLFEQAQLVLSELSRSNPFLIILDDLQWVDSASVDLLFHLSRHLSGQRILILGAYRPEQLELDREGDQHPLRNVITEFKRSFGEISLDLGRLPSDENREFVEDYLDSDPNRLDRAFRDALYGQTEGHPLFTVELLLSMVERGDLARDHAGRWVQDGEIDWGRLPQQVEGVIQARLQRLEPAVREMIDLASLEGEVFTAEVLAMVLDVDERQILRLISQDLILEHRLVREQGYETIHGRRLSRFSFHHGLFQQYVYRSIGEGERTRYHAAVGGALEAIYAHQADRISPQLARHFLLGDVTEKGVRYAIQAGDQARLAHAYREALEHYKRALGHLEGSGQAELLARTLLKVGLIHIALGNHAQANAINQQAFELWEPLRRVWERKTADGVGKSLSIAVEEPRSLDPGQASDDASIFLVNQLFEGLVLVDYENNVLPAAASRWEIEDDGKRYRFHLRDGLKWSDGSALKAQDFASTWRRNLRLADQSPAAHLLHVIENARAYAKGDLQEGATLGIQVLDERTLEVVLETPIAYLPHLLTHPVTYPMSGVADAERDPGGLDPPPFLSNGPYEMAGDPGETGLTMQRNPHYMGSFPGNVRTVDLIKLDTYKEAFKRFDQGEIDIVSLIMSDPATVRQASRLYGERLRLVPQPSTLYLTFYCTGEPFNRPEMRRAFVHAVNREKLVSEVSQGQYRFALGGFLPPGLPGHQPEIGLPHDPGLARKLMAQADLPKAGNDLTLEFLYTGPDENNSLVDYLCKTWEEILGVQVDARNSPWEVFVNRMNSDPPPLSVMGYTADYPDPDAMLRVLFHSTEGYNWPHWSDRDFDRLVERAAILLDSAERINCYQEAERILVSREAAVMPLGYAQSRSLIRPGIKVPPVPANRLRLKDIVC